MRSTACWPRLLPPGGTIGICSPAGPTRNPEAMERAKTVLEARGYRVTVSPQALAQHPERDYLAGDDAGRAADLNLFFQDPTVDLFLMARGGYGCAKLLDRLDYGALAANPRPLVGYSDITALSLAIAARGGVVSFSGIMATAGHGFGEDSLDPQSEAFFWQMVAAQRFNPVLASPPESPPWQILRGPNTLSGPIFPVCLTLLTSLLGTPYIPNLDGAILIIEDVKEELYAVDRALTQLRLAGVLERVCGVLVGSFNGVEGQDELLAREVPRLVAEMTPSTVAVASGIPYGHIPCRWTVPVGAAGTVELRAGCITFAHTPPHRDAPANRS